MTNNPPFPPFRPGDLPPIEAGALDPETAGDATAPEPSNVIQRVDRNQLKHFMTAIRSAEHQVGEHIITALQDDGTVAVLTTVMIGPDGVQRIVSAGLDPSLMMEVQKMLNKATADRDEEVPCVGFHCYVKPKKLAPKLDAGEAPPEVAPDAAP